MGTYGVMGMLERMREPSVDGVAPSRRGVAAGPFLLDVAEGVSSTRRRNCWLFIVRDAGVHCGRSALARLHREDGDHCSTAIMS